MADDVRPRESEDLEEHPAEDDGVREAVEATHATVRSALDRIRESREILADSLKPIDELLVDMRATLDDRPPADRPARDRGGDDLAPPPAADAPAGA